MNEEQKAFLQDVLERMSRGLTTYRDAAWLGRLIKRLEGDIVTLTAIIEKEADCEQSTGKGQFDGAGTAD